MSFSYVTHLHCQLLASKVVAKLVYKFTFGILDCFDEAKKIGFFLFWGAGGVGTANHLPSFNFILAQLFSHTKNLHAFTTFMNLLSALPL